MAGIETSIRLQNQMTPVLNDIISAMNRMQSEIYKIESASNAAFDASNLKAAQSAISQANVQLRQVEQEMNNFSENTKQAAQEMNKFSENTKQAAQETNNFLGNTKKVAHSSNTLLSTLKKIAVTLGVIKGVKVFVRMSDDMALANSRLNLIKREGESVAEINKKIYESAQRSRGDYMMTADAVSKLGTQAKNAFKNTDEIIAFTEQLNKMFVLSGTSASGIESVMYNLTQAMASGLLRGQDLNAVISNTPLIMEEVAKYMNISIGEIRNMAQEGKLTADVVKNALLSSAEETNNKFKDMNMTFGQIGVMIKNTFVKNLAPALQAFNELLNTQEFKNFIEDVSIDVASLTFLIEELADIVMTLVGFIAGNSDLIIGAVLGVSAAYGAWILATEVLTAENIALAKSFLTNPVFIFAAAIALLTYNLAQSYIAAGKAKSMSEAVGMALDAVARAVVGLTAVVLALDLAIKLLTGTMLANPITLILVLIAGVIYMIYRWVKAVGGLRVAWAIGMNAILTTGENAKLGVRRITDGILNAIGYMKIKGSSIIQAFINFVINRINDLIYLVNKIPGIAIQKIQNVEFAAQVKVKAEAERMARGKASKELENMYRKNQEERAKNIEALQLETKGKSEVNPMSDMLAGLGDIQQSLDSIGSDTGKIKDSVAWDNNSLTGLKDLMFARSVTGLSKEVRLEVNNSFTGNISSELDLEELTEKANDKLIKRLAIELNGGY